MSIDLTEHALRDPLALAIAVLGDRIRTLPSDDREDLYDLTKALVSAESDEDRDAVLHGMLEILDQRGSGVRELAPEPPGEELQTWMTYVGRRIRQFRTGARLTQEALAEKAGLPQSHISKLETGKHSPSSLTLHKIAAALGIEAGQLDPSA